MNTQVRARLGALALSLPLWATAAHAQTPAFVWLEGETPTHANITANVDGYGSGNLSGDKWLNLGADEKNVEAFVPKDGILLDYDFNAPSAGKYGLWNRMGFEVDRSAFDYQLDGGAWQTIPAGAPTVDLTELGFWAHVSWLHMGEAQLGAGKHTLHIRVNVPYGGDKKPQKLHYTSDVIALVQGEFHPDGPVKPGEVGPQTDMDKAAAAQVFQLAAPKDAGQTTLSLKGNWQIGRYDEGETIDRTEPFTTAPALDTVHWKGIPIPSDRDKTRPDLTFAHRYFLRARVNVPAAMAGRSLMLHLPSINMLGSLFVNGQLCGTTKAPFAAWDCDITRAVKPGQINEIWVGIKDTHYALKPEDGKSARSRFVIPTQWMGVGFISQSLDFPVWNHTENGILQTPTLIAGGPAYTSDVFPIPSVKNKSLGLEITLKNPTDAPINVSVRNAIQTLVPGVAAAKTFAPKSVTLAANSEQVVKLSEAWADPKLWWPDDANPQQYNVVTTLDVDGKPVDERKTKFGFREWDWSGPIFKLNGLPWYGHADTATFGDTAQSDLVGLKAHGENMIRLWGETGWHEYTDPEDALNFFDAHGMNIRRTGIFDGEGVNYTLTPELLKNWQTQVVAWAKGQRNHPSIFIWSIENEVTFINNGRGHGPTTNTDPFMRDAAKTIGALDPTRPQMVDGGNALTDESLPVYGIHYIEGGVGDYPDWGYNLTHEAIANADGWPITHQRPLFFGETFFSPGYDLGSLAAAGGESTLVGKGESYPAVGLIGKMMSEGYRWSGNVAAYHLWMGRVSDLYYNSWQPIAVLTRQWDSSFGAGQKVKRTFGIFNDTHEEQPLSFTWTLMVGGKKAGSKTTSYTLAPASNKKFDDTIAMPQVPSRQEGELVLSLSKGGKEVFHDVKAISVLPAFKLAALGAPTRVSSTRANASFARMARLDRQTNGSFARTNDSFAQTDSPFAQTNGSDSQTNRPFAQTGGRLSIETRANALATPRAVGAGGGGLLLFDPRGTVAAFLKGHAVAFAPVADLAKLPASGKVLVVGQDALDRAQSTSSALAAWASSGRAVIVLEQKNPLQFQALPADINTTKDQGRMGFPEDLEHPAFRGLTQRDFGFWGTDNILYRAAYEKPTSGGKSLLQAGDGLRDTALVEVPAGTGVLLLSQLTLAENLADNAVAGQLLGNLIRYGADYKLVTRAASLVVGAGTPLAKAVAATGLQFTPAPDVLAALGKPGSVAVVDASPANLQTLAANLPKVQAFTAGGGWIVFNNLTPDGLDPYNKLVGVQHIIRKFGREKVTFPTVRNPLTAGLSTSSVVMGNGQRIFGFQAGDYPAEDAYSYVVDYDDVAPFATSGFGNYGQIVNNFVGADGWPLIIDFPAPKDGKPFDIPISLPRPETITELKYIDNSFYNWTNKLNLVFDGKDKVSYDVAPNSDPQILPVTPPRRAKDVTLQIAAWDDLPGKNGNIGIDNIYLKAQRSSEFYAKVKPMLNIGALMEYPQGKGGMVLCNVNFKDSESLPENAGKKQAILATILRNLSAPFSGGKSIIAGANLTYTPIDLGKSANAYRGEQGWFGDKTTTFKDLPTGAQRFANVPYNVYDFKTSPVPTALILGGDRVPGGLADHINGIPVGQKADALFFLQAARIDNRMNDDDRKNGRKFEMARYVVHYADGQTVNIPVVSEVNVDDAKQPQAGGPRALPGAQIAWTAPYAGSDQMAVAYSMQWNNPRPDAVIQSIDFQYGQDRRGIPALLALTAAVGK